MDRGKYKAIERIVDSCISCFAEGLSSRYVGEVSDPSGVINSKKNNCFIAELGDEFMFYSAFVRSFDSSFGNCKEALLEEYFLLKNLLDDESTIRLFLERHITNMEKATRGNKNV